MKPGRNDTCPCGSGKKYKKCCLATELQAHAEDFGYARFRAVESKLIPRLLDHAFDAFGENAIHEAWNEFNDTLEEEEATTDDPMNMAFMPWFFFNWVVEHEDDKPAERTPLFTTVAEDFLKTYDKQLSSDEKTILVASNRRPYSLCEVIEPKPGVGLVLFDIFQQIQYEVIEKTASKLLRQGEIILCATMLPVAGKLMNVGTAPYPLPPVCKAEILELRRTLLRHRRRKNFTENMLREEEPFVLGFYLDSLDSLFNPERTLTNTDGELLVFHKVIFNLKCTPVEAFESLKDLASPEPDDDLLDNAKRDADGGLLAVGFPWLNRNPDPENQMSAPIVLGDINIQGTKLTVQVNSKERGDRIRAEIERRLGDRCIYKAMLVEPLESNLGEMEAGRRSAHSSSGAIPSEQLPHEIHEKMADMIRQHWAKWFDIPVPALNGMTPRDAAKTDEGRDLLKSLLLHYEHQNEKSQDNLLRVDVAMLRRELGL